ncbi:MAG TPA: twin-arginine translocase TatA/TatE family subunit [Flavobacterium sp.]|nr:twin-arginine translocase TatA/TatE family subunit [Flavobacterium sp.]
MIAQTIFLGSIGAPEYIMIVIALLLLFGGKKIPELMKGLGSGLKEFKTAAREDQPKKDAEPNV